MYACDPSTSEVEAEVQGHPWLGLGPIYPNEFLSQQTIKTAAKTAEILPNTGISCILLT